MPGSDCRIIGELLGHAQAGMTARYAHLDADPLRRASDRNGDRIAAAMGDVNPTGEGANVVPMPRGKRRGKEALGRPPLFARDFGQDCWSLRRLSKPYSSPTTTL